MAHGQYREAAAQLTDGLAVDPEDALLLATLARCQSEMGDKKQALATARKAMGLSGEDNYARQITCQILIDLDKYKEAEKLATEGLALDPEDEGLLVCRGVALFGLNRYKESLACARLALEIDPENESALWLQTQCQSLLRQRGAEQSSLEHLARNPEGAAMQSHAFLLLRQGRTKEAYETFLQALRNDPNDESAREGLKEAIRGRFFLYRWLQAYSFWCQSFGRFWYVPFVILVIGRGVIRSVLRDNPGLAPYLIPVGVVLFFLLWGYVILSPLLNGILHVHPYGRYALRPSERWIGRYWLVSVVTLLVAGILALAGLTTVAVPLAFAGGLLWVMQGLASYFSDEKVALVFSHALGVIVTGLGTIAVIAFAQGPSELP